MSSSLLEFLNHGDDTVRVSNSTATVLGNLVSGLPTSDLPVTAEKSSWITLEDPERLTKEFEFTKFNHLVYFVNESLRYQEASNHHVTMIIDHRTVRVEAYTHDVDSVTSQDIDLTSFLDEVYDDVRFLHGGSHNERV